MIQASIIGATGYTGSELIRLLAIHPDVEIKYLTSRSYVGQNVNDYYPFLSRALEKKFIACDDETFDAIFSESDVVFIALPHGHSMRLSKKAFEKNYKTKMIDLGADFRLKDIETYEEIYEVEQEAPEVLQQAVYGWPEQYREEIRQAQVIANPGCFVTANLLALKPAIEKKLIDPSKIISDCKTGMSGAGRSTQEANLFSEITSNFKAYSVTGHRHIPEMEQELNRLNQMDHSVQIHFTPHLLPVERGIYATIYADLSDKRDEKMIRRIYQETYQDEPFVEILAEGQIPELKNVRGTNNTQLQVTVDQRLNQLVIIAVLDNLQKGASGQAVQNMNILFDLDEITGLDAIALVP